MAKKKSQNGLASGSSLNPQASSFGQTLSDRLSYSFVPLAASFVLPYHPAKQCSESTAKKSTSTIPTSSPPTTASLSDSKQFRTKKERNRKRNIAGEFERYFGEETKLENWQRLCRDVGIKDDLPSVTQCKIALKKVWVNIFDLLDAVEQNTCPPQRFANRFQLKEYTMDTGLIFPKKRAKEGGPVKNLLAHIFL